MTFQKLYNLHSRRGANKFSFVLILKKFNYNAKFFILLQFVPKIVCLAKNDRQYHQKIC